MSISTSALKALEGYSEILDHITDPDREEKIERKIYCDCCFGEPDTLVTLLEDEQIALFLGTDGYQLLKSLDTFFLKFDESELTQNKGYTKTAQWREMIAFVTIVNTAIKEALADYQKRSAKKD